MRFFLIFILCLVSTRANAQNEKERLFEETVYNIIEAYNIKSSDLINKYINPDFGIYILIKTGTTAYWQHRNLLCLESDCMSNFNIMKPYSQILMEQKLYDNFLIQYKNVIDTSSEDGLFSDNQNTHILTKIIREFHSENGLNIINKHRLRGIWKMESKSRRIILSKKEYNFWNKDFIFHLSYINKRWYLSIIDYVSIDMNT